MFVAVYQKALTLLYVDTLLEKIKDKFEAVHKPGVYEYDHFEDTFRKVLKDCEAKADTFRRQGNVKTPSSAKVQSNMVVWIIRLYFQVFQCAYSRQMCMYRL